MATILPYRACCMAFAALRIYPPGKIEAIDLSEALNVAGVVKNRHRQDIPGTPVVGIIVKDYLPIVKDEVVFHGDVVAVVAATSYEAACEGGG